MVSGRMRVWTGAMLLGVAVSGCMSPSGDTQPVDRARPNLSAEDAGESTVIASLLDRSSVLKSGSPYHKTASAVLEANSRTAEAELRIARLRREAADKNWLPSLSPQISLTSLGSVVANMFVEQVLYDNGRKKAERAFAKADVEVAAAALALDTNERVHTALKLYVEAERAREDSAVASQGLTRMREFERVMRARVDGGVSDRSELSVITSKRAQLEARVATATAARATAMAELNAMSARPLDGVTGLSTLRAGTRAPEQALSVIKAGAEAERAMAEATIARAGLLPGLKASGTVGDNGTGIGLSVSAEQGLGFGTKANLQAVAASRDAAERRVSQAREDARRRVRSLQSREGALITQANQSKALESGARETYTLFQQQFEVGHRTVMDVVGVFETLLKIEQDSVALKYDKALVQIELAKELGVLVDGADI